jgi:hypothetical protein
MPNLSALPMGMMADVVNNLVRNNIRVANIR